MEKPAPRKGNKPENDAKSLARGADNDDDDNDDSSYFTMNTLRLHYKDKFLMTLGSNDCSDNHLNSELYSCKTW